MTKVEIVAELDRRMRDLTKSSLAVPAAHRIDELRVFKMWVERQ